MATIRRLHYLTAFANITTVSPHVLITCAPSRMNDTNNTPTEPRASSASPGCQRPTDPYPLILESAVGVLRNHLEKIEEKASISRDTTEVTLGRVVLIAGLVATFISGIWNTFVFLRSRTPEISDMELAIRHTELEIRSRQLKADANVRSSIKTQVIPDAKRGWWVEVTAELENTGDAPIEIDLLGDVRDGESVGGVFELVRVNSIENGTLGFSSSLPLHVQLRQRNGQRGERLQSIVLPSKSHGESLRALQYVQEPGLYFIFMRVSAMVPIPKQEPSELVTMSTVVIPALEAQAFPSLDKTSRGSAE